MIARILWTGKSRSCAQLVELGSAIRQLNHSVLDSATAQLLLSRKRAELEDLIKRGAPMSEPLKWYDHTADNPPWIKALAEVRHRACREGSTSMRKQRWATGTIF